jgi:hypothetical protein
MKLRASTTITLGVVSSLAAIVGACTAFSSESSDTPDASAVEDARSTVPPVSSSAPDTGRIDPDPSPDASVPDAAPRECTGGCGASSFCEDGTCLPTLCTGDGGVVVLRPKSVVDQIGTFTTFPASTSILDTVREPGEGDGDGTYVEALMGNGRAAIKLEAMQLQLPPNREIDAVNLRTRAKRTDTTVSAQVGIIYWLNGGTSVYGQNPKTNVGTGYDVVNFYLAEPPFVAPGTKWTAQRVNDVRVGVEALGTTDNAAVRITQVWVEVCLKAL